MRRVAMVGIMLAGLVGASPVSAQVFFDNFESPQVSAASGTQRIVRNRTFSPGLNASGDAWTVVAGNIDVVQSSTTNPYIVASGSQAVELVGDRLGTIERSTALAAGHSYVITFQYAGNNLAPPSLFEYLGAIEVFDALGNGVDLFQGVHNTLADGEFASAAGSPYELYSAHFTAAMAGNYTFSLRANNRNGSAGILIDDFAVSAAVPEIGTWAMLTIGFGAIGGLLRRRRAMVGSEATAV